MSDQDSSKGKDKIYDRIFKENAQYIFIPLIEMELGIKIKSFKSLPSELPKTIGRRVDVLYQIENESGTEQILHIEFQTSDDKMMLERTAEYHGIIYRKYLLPIRHVVIYVGKGRAKMRTKLKEDEVFRGFDLINIHTIDTNKLLSSQVPEVVILALLSDYGEERTEAILRLILRRLKTASVSDNDLNKYIEQLILLSKLRKLETVTAKIISDMPITYDIEQDYFYQQGIQKERERTKQEREKAKQDKIHTIKALLAMKNLSVDKIAEITNTTVEFVAKIKQE